MSRWRACLAILAVAVGFAVTPTTASAYGSDAIYQITFSFNCDNPTVPACQPSLENPFGLGGFWGWIELDGSPGATSGTDGNFVGTGCSHNPPTGPTGADHIAFNDVVWTTFGPTLALSSPSHPELGTLFLPATPGHYSMHPAPGVANEVEIVRIPGR